MNKNSDMQVEISSRSTVRWKDLWDILATPKSRNFVAELAERLFLLDKI